MTKTLKRLLEETRHFIELNTGVGKARREYRNSLMRELQARIDTITEMEAKRARDDKKNN